MYTYIYLLRYSANIKYWGHIAIDILNDPGEALTQSVYIIKYFKNVCIIGTADYYGRLQYAVIKPAKKSTSLGHFHRS